MVSNRRSLCIIETNGNSFLAPVVIDTQMQAVSCSWNHDGTIFAVCGTVTGPSDKEANQVSFYSAYGVVSVQHITLVEPVLKYPLSPSASSIAENTWS